MSTEHFQPANPANSSTPLLQVESRPPRLLAARYDQMPFPNIGPTQEVAFDLGMTAHNSDMVITGVVFAGYNDHQLLFEQRWPARIIQKRLGDADLTIPANSGLALRSLHFLLHGYEQLTHVEVTVVGKTVNPNGTAGERIESMLQIPVIYPEQRTDLHFPLRGAWWAIQAADWSDQHKQEVFSQVYAIDLVKLGPDNNFFRGNGSQLTDHYSWNEPVYATAGGKVAHVCYDMPDLLPGTPPNPLMFRGDPGRILGNAVAISHGNGEFSYYGHLQQASLLVREGEMIRRGTLLGRVGSSGSSPGPHLHFQLMDGPNLFIDQGLPLKFSHFSAGGQFFEQPITIPTRMIVFGPEKEPEKEPETGQASNEQ